jgi:glycosyltransferase involved in cell wall biosynthesis
LISETIESALAVKTYPTQIIVVDDGSTDGTSEVLKRYQDKIQYYFISHSGCASARNFGISRAKGKYIIILDSDDLLEPNRLEDEIPILEKDAEIAFTFSPYFLFWDNGMNRTKLILPMRNRSSDLNLSQSFFMNSNIPIPTVVFRRECLQKNLFDNTLRYHEDGDLILRLLIQYKKAACSNCPSVKIRVHPGMKSKNRVEIYKAIIKSHEKIASEYPDFVSQLGNLYKKRYLELCYRLGRSYLFQGDLVQAKDWMKKGKSEENSLRWKATVYFSILCLPRFISLPLLKLARKI